MLSVAALVALLWMAIGAGDARRLVAFTIFGLSQIALAERIGLHFTFVSEVERYWDLAEPFRMVHVVTTDYHEIVAQHEQLVDALAAHDRVLTIRAMNEHRRDTLTAALTALAALAARTDGRTSRALS